MSLTSLPGYTAFLLAVFAASALTTALVLHRLRIIDIPNERSSHTRPTPRGGGLGIVLGYLLALCLIRYFGDAGEITALQSLPHLGLLLAVLLIGGISLHDDIAARGFASKLLVQLIAAALLMICGLSIPSDLIAPLPGWLAWPLTLIWLVGLTNAYNFMDGLDGMAAGTAVVAAAFFALICHMNGQPLPGLMASALSIASCGFLLFNWPPAKIFMGDIGSTFLGFLFAALPLLLLQSNPAPATVPWLLLTMPLLLLHYLFDTLFTFTRRLLAGENVTQAHRSHLYQLLQRGGWSHLRVSLLYAGLAAMQGVTALCILKTAAPTLALLLALLAFLLLYTLLAFVILRRARSLSLI